MKPKYLLADYCRHNRTDSVLELLTEYSDLNILYDDGVYFKYAIENNNVIVLNRLIEYYNKAVCSEKDEDEAFVLLHRVLKKVTDGQVLPAEIKEILAEIVAQSDDSVSERSDVSVLDDENDYITKERDDDHLSTSSLSAGSLKPLEYQYYRDHMKPLNYKYWLLNLEAEKFYEQGEYSICRQLIIEATNCVTRNKNMISNSEYKAIVIYNYLRFVSEEELLDGISYKDRLVNYLPSVSLVAERSGDEIIMHKSLKLMKQYSGGLDSNSLTEDERSAESSIAMQLPVKDPYSSNHDDTVKARARSLTDPITSDEDSAMIAYGRDSGSSSYTIADLTKQLEGSSLGLSDVGKYDDIELSGVEASVLNDEL